MTIKEYFSSLFKAIVSLVKGLQVTGKELVTPKVTEQYPENRSTTLKIADRFRATLEFDYNEEGVHKCIACGMCQMSCPNGTIEVRSKMIEVGGKKKKVLDKYIYDLGSCTFCMLCVTSCPTKAIKFSNDFEQSVFTRDKLVKQLNYLPEKEAPAPTPVAKPATPVAPKAAAPTASVKDEKPAAEAAKAEAAPAPAPKAETVAPAAAPAAAEEKVAYEVEAPTGKVMTVKLAKDDVDAIEKMVAEQPGMTKFQAMQAVIKAKKAAKA